MRLHECYQYNYVNLDETALQGIKPSGCVCPGDILTYQCEIIMGSFFGATIWTGSALDGTCRYIFLLHSRFPLIRQCNNGTIVAEWLSTEGNNYTSQLNVTITPETAGKTVACGYDNGTHYSVQHSIVIPSPSGLLL